MNVFAKFDKIPSMILEVIKETKCYGHTFGWWGITMMGWSPRCYIPSFVEISPSVPEKIFKVFLPYIGVAAHLGHVTWTIYTNFRSPFPRRLHIKFGINWSSGFQGEDV